jgi:hypothetical protein
VPTLRQGLSQRTAVREGEVHATERQYMEVLAVRSEAGCESVADTNSMADGENWQRIIIQNPLKEPGSTG